MDRDDLRACRFREILSSAACLVDDGSGRRLPTLVIAAILCGTLGYAVATFVGVAVGSWLHAM